MRHLHTLPLLLLPFGLSAQTVVSVQNGPWTAPSTWDCNCVPGPGNSLVIMHSVQIMGDLTFTFPQVQVTNTGEITMMFPATIVLGGTFLIEGHVLLIGEVSNPGGTIDVSWLFEVIGQFNNDGDLIMDGGMMQVEGDFNNYDQVDGNGSICVYDTTDNQGTITGTVDICDASPTTSTAPIVDSNTGTIAGTVTYCTNSACGFAGVDEAWADGISVFPNPASGPMALSGLAGVRGMLVIRDATGRVVHQERLTGTEGTLAIEAPSEGIFLAELTTDAGSKTWKLIFAEEVSQ